MELVRGSFCNYSQELQLWRNLLWTWGNKKKKNEYVDDSISRVAQLYYRFCESENPSRKEILEWYYCLFYILEEEDLYFDHYQESHFPTYLPPYFLNKETSPYDKHDILEGTSLHNNIENYFNLEDSVSLDLQEDILHSLDSYEHVILKNYILKQEHILCEENQQDP